VYAASLGLSDGYPDPVTRWLVVASVCAASAVVMTWISNRLRVLAVAERRAAAEVARLNAVLSDRVDDLGTFLSPHVAAAVRDTGDRAVLEPHRRQVAVLFVDLRGFTSFTAGAEPEDVVEVLGQFYATVGEVAQRRDASIGSFAGDGVMAYLGDPLPLDDAAGDAVAMAMELRIALEDLRNRWCGSGYRLGYGIGIAYGYVTLGVVGYEGRRDYTALGTVGNLAARLCGEAADGEIVLDARTKLAVDGQVDTEARAVVAKGFTEPVSAHVIPSATSRDPSTT
jgi:class 3 adenylate cyclase